ncbi:MAG: lipoprotein-releasing ABC transporter permease subunit [Alphaproteobacteria bacterium]|nr:MAG: lipoprotein-releasing ABC transporter permease subunit [Alphaproteobacteria bacterium]
MAAKRKERAVSLITGFSFTGIMLGVATLITVMSVMNGFREEITRSILGFNGHIVLLPSMAKGINDYEALVEKIKQNPTISHVSAIVEGQALVFQGSQATGVVVHGISAVELSQRTHISRNIKQGTLDTFVNSNNSVVIGMNLARRLGVFLGDMLTLVAPEANNTAFGLIPRMRAFTVSAVFEAGMSEFDKGMVFIPLSAAQQFFRLPEHVNKIEIFTTNPMETHRLTPQLAALRPGLRALDWKQLNHTFFSSIETERTMMFLILTLIVVVAAFNIISSITMLVKDKRTSIGILRAMGQSRQSIHKIFIYCGFRIGFLGTLAGLVLGLVLSWNIETVQTIIQFFSGAKIFSPDIYFLAKLPAQVNFTEVLTIVALSLSMSTAASYLPAATASSLHPVEALRHD